MTTNRKNTYSTSNRAKTQYKITAIKINKDSNKDEQKKHLQSFRKNYFNKRNEVNIAAKIKSNKDFFTTHILAIGLRKDLTVGLTAKNTNEANFLFFDFEKTRSGGDKSTLSFDKCLEILEHNNMNYILKTSYSHTEQEQRLHLLLPLLKPIESNDTYKYYFDFIRDKYFSEYECDLSANSIARWIYSSNSASLRYKYCFEMNDIIIDNNINKKKKKSTVNYASSPAKPYTINEEVLNIFNKQVKSLHGFIYNRDGSTNEIIKYSRNESDKIPNIFYALNNSDYDPYAIIDKKNKHSVLFSYDDILNSINPADKRDELLCKLKIEIEHWFIDGGKYYAITNEGLGKSSTIIDLGKSNNFIFVCHTNERVKEVEQSFKDRGIESKIIYSNATILERCGEEKLVNNYSESMKKNKKLSFLSFIKQNIKDENQRIEIEQFYDTNLKNFKEDNCVRIITSQKLKFTLLVLNNEDKDKASMLNQKIIFDEFNFDQWALYEEGQKDDENTTSEPSIWIPKHDTERNILLRRKHESFYDLFKSFQNILILTTERTIIDVFFYNTEYKGLIVSSGKISSNKSNVKEHKGLKVSDNFNLIEHIKFDKKMYDDSIQYIITKSTKKGEVRDQLITDIKDRFQKRYKEDIYIISDGTDLKDKSHIAIKGSNKYKGNNLLIIGTLGAEISDNIFYYSCINYFEAFREYYSQPESQDNNNFNNKIRNIIVRLHMSNQVSQSIGRNSGFRRNGAKTVVVLPLLDRNSKRSFEQFPLNYVSPDVIFWACN